MNRLDWALLILLAGTIFVINSCSGIDDPGFRAAVTSKGLDYLNEIGIPLLKKELSKIDIPDVSDKADILIGKVKYKLKNIHLSQFEVGSSSLTSSAGKGLTLQATGITIQVKGDWSYKSWFASDHGSVKASASSISLTVSILVGATSTGQPSVTSTGCSFNVGRLSVKLSGGASWLYNLFDGVFERQIKRALNSKVCDLTRNSINKGANKALSSLPAVIKIDQYAELSYALLKEPVFTLWFVLTNHRGEFLSVSQPNVQPSFTPSPLPPMPSTLDSSCSMVQLWATDYMVNTAAFVYMRAGILHYNITSDMLYHKYPDKNMTIGIRAMENEPPFISISLEGANLTVPMAIDFYVIDGDHMPLAFTLKIMALLDTEVLVEEDRNDNNLIVKGNAKSMSAISSIVETNVGNFEISKIQGIFDILSKSVLLGQINKFANKGFPIPNVKNLQFVRPSLQLGKGYVIIETDINYSVT